MDDNTTQTAIEVPPVATPSPLEDAAANVQPINFTEDTSSTTPIDILPPPISSGLNQNGTVHVANVAHYALQDKSPGVVALADTIQKGEEGTLRQTAAFDQKIKQNQAAMFFIKQITQNGEQPLTPEQETAVTSLAQSMQDPDPNTILEKMWSHNYVKELMTQRSVIVHEALQALPMTTMGVAGRADDLIATRQAVSTLAKRFEKRYEDMPIFDINSSMGAGGTKDKATSWLTSIIPGANWYSKLNAIEGFNGEILPGANAAQMKDYVYLLPTDKAIKVVEAAAERIWQLSPHAAMDFLNDMVSMPDSKMYVDNLMGVVDVATTIPAGAIVRGAKAAARTAERTAANAVAERAIAVPVTEEFAKANEHIIFSPQDLIQLKREQRLEKEFRTIHNPRGMTVYELKKAADAFPEEGSYPPSYDFYAHQRASVGPTEGTEQITGYYSGGQRYPLTEGTKFIDPEELSKLPPGSRLFTDKDGNLSVTRQENGKWKPTGEKITLSDTPEQGLAPFSLGAERKAMGSKYYDDFSVGEPISAVNKGRVADPAELGLRDLDRIREGIPAEMLGKKFDLDAFKAANSQVIAAEKKYDDARRVLDDVHKSGVEADIAAQKKVVEQAKNDLDTAKNNWAKSTVWKSHPLLTAADQNLRAYLSSGIRSLKDIPINAVETRADLQGALSTLGRIDEAVATGSIRKATEMVSPEPPTFNEAVVSMGRDLPSVIHPNPFVENASANSREGVSRMAEQLRDNWANLNSAASGQRVQRQTREEMLANYEQAKADVIAKYRDNFNNSVIDQTRHYDPMQNLYYVKTRVGTTEAKGFDTANEARNVGLQTYRIPERDFYVTQEGSTFYIEVMTPVKETIKDTPIPTNNQTPNYWGGFGLKKLRSAADQLSELHMQARYTATHGPQRINQVVKSIVDQINTLPTEDFNRLGQILKQSELDFDANGNKGVWYSVSKLEQEYGRRYGNLPSNDFVQAYYTYKQLMDFDYELRKNYVYSMMAKWGSETWKFKVGDGISPEFHGRKVDSIDTDKLRNRGILVVKDGEAKEYWTYDYKINPEVTKLIDDYVSTGGADIVQLWAPWKKPLRSVNGHDIYYVITNSATRRNLDPSEVLPYRGGPHIAYTHPHFIGQPKIGLDGKGQAIYAGDEIFLSGGSSEAEGRMWAKKYDTARQLLNAGDDAALANYLRDNLPHSVDSFKKLFTGDGGLNRDMPIAYKKSGQDIFSNNPDLFDDVKGYNGQIYKFKDMKEYMNDLANPELQLNSGFLQERSNRALQVPKDLGNSVPDRFVLEGASELDPYISLNRALKQANRVHYMEDMKVMAAESWVKEFGQHLKDVNPNVLRRNPLHYLYDGKFNSATPQDVVMRGEQFRQHVKDFIGMQSEFATELAHYESKMQDILYNKLGGEATRKVIERPFVSGYLIPFIKDPASYARAWAFNTHLGVFNPIQYWQQGISATQVVSISPRAGMEGVKAASWLHAGGKYALDDPAKLDFYASKMAKTGWGGNKDDAKEALIAYRDSGFGLIGNETAWYNDFSDPKMFQNAAGKMLDKGAYFFKKGEGFNRDTAYFTAFKEWKLENPGRVADQYDLGAILRRAEDLTSNMTRAANASFQNNGLLSIPLQFQTFRIRQAELLWGGRLDGAEKGRMILMNSVLWGIPTAISAPILSNFYEDIKVAANNRGINLTDGYLAVMHGGIIKYLTYLATGKELDFPTAMGPGASSLPTQVKDILMGESTSKALAELVTGPVGSDLKAIYDTTVPFMRNVIGKVTGTEYPLKTDDFIRFANLTTVTDNARATWEAYNTGKYFSKSGQPIGDATTWDGLLKLGFGLTNQQFQDAFAQARDRKKIIGRQEKALQEMTNLYHKANQALLNNDQQGSDEYFKRADYIGIVNDITFEKRAQAYTDSIRNKDLMQRMNDLFYKAPTQSQRERDIERKFNQGGK